MTIPAHAGIHRPITPKPEKNTPGSHKKTLRHPRKTPSFPQHSVIPAKAGMTLIFPEPVGISTDL